MNFKSLDRIFDDLQKTDCPSSDIIVCKDGNEIYRNRFGLMPNGKTEITSDNYFYMYSCTKVITAVCAMQLIEKGKIGLDDPVYKYLPAYKNVFLKDGSKAKNTMTVRHLLSMQGGLNYDWDMKPIKDALKKSKFSTIDIVNAFALNPLEFEPGTSYEYSFCLDVIGAIIEVVSGMKFSEYAKKYVFDPLEMDRMTFHLTDDIAKKIPQVYRYNSEKDKIEKTDEKNVFVLSENYESGGAGLIGSPNSYIKLSMALSNYGKAKNGYQLLSKSSIDMMRTDQLKDEFRESFWKSNDGYGYGLGVRTLIDKSKSLSPIGEFGWDSATCGYTAIDVENNIAIYYQAHVLGWGPGYELHKKMRDSVYEALQN